MSFLDGTTVLITGGTGSFGKAFVAAALRAKVKKVIVLRSEERRVGKECRL